MSAIKAQNKMRINIIEFGFSYKEVHYCDKTT